MPPPEVLPPFAVRSLAVRATYAIVAASFRIEDARRAQERARELCRDLQASRASRPPR